MVCMAVATALLAWLMQHAVNDVFVERDMQAMWLIASSILVLSVVKGAADYAQTVIMARISNGIVASLQRRMFEKLIRFPIGYFDKAHSSKLIARINNNARAASSALSLVATSLGRDLLTLIGLVTVMAVQDPWLCLGVLFIGPIVVFGIHRIIRQLPRLSDSELDGMADVISTVQETTLGIRTVKSFTLEPLMCRRFEQAVSDVEAKGNAIARLGALTSPLMETLGGVVIAGTVVYAGWQTIDRGKTPGEFMAFATAFLLAYEPAKRLANGQVALQRTLRRVRNLFEFLDSTERENYGSDAMPASPISGHLVLRGIDFGYGNRPVLQDISLEVRPGEIVAIVGPSGAGKSTLFSLLQRFHDPWSGTITIDDQNTSHITLTDLRRLISVVSQEVTLFKGSVGDNIRLGRLEANQLEVEAAAVAASAHDFISSMPNRFDTLIGERNATISGGQAQRLAIARAILKDAPILLLDEATSALDAITELEVRNALAELTRGRSTLVIAHRASTIENADRIYLLDEGQIVGSGRHADLLASSDLYRQLFGEAVRGPSGRQAA